MSTGLRRALLASVVVRKVRFERAVRELGDARDAVAMTDARGRETCSDQSGLGLGNLHVGTCPVRGGYEHRWLRCDESFERSARLQGVRIILLTSNLRHDDLV